ncbi:MAG: PAAR domain-containing protein [Pseudomonadota bacterium]
MKRHTITLGASTTAGGKVISASSHGSINGVAIALEGDTIFCKGCKGPGRIVCVGPRISETWSGKQIALENDLCACGCSPPPRLVPNQTVRYQVLTGDGDMPMPVSAGHAVDDAKGIPTGPATHADFTEQFVLLNDASGEPLPRAAYTIARSASKEESGTTNDAGRTHV